MRVSGLEKVIVGRIYGIINLVNSKIYVGQTKRTLKERMEDHKYGDLYVDKAIKEYGWENFRAEVIEECTTFEELNEREKFWITELNSLYPNGYNLTNGGKHGNIVYLWKKEYRANMSVEAKILESKRDPLERSLSAKKAWATKTYEERLQITEPARKAAAEIPIEQKRAIRKKACAAMTFEARQQMTENARKALQNRTYEQRLVSANKSWATRRARAAEKRRLIKKLIDLIKKLF